MPVTIKECPDCGSEPRRIIELIESGFLFGFCCPRMGRGCPNGTIAIHYSPVTALELWNGGRESGAAEGVNRCR